MKFTSGSAGASGETYPQYLGRQARRTQFKATMVPTSLKPAKMAQPMRITPARAASIRGAVRQFMGGR